MSTSPAPECSEYKTKQSENSSQNALLTHQKMVKKHWKTPQSYLLELSKSRMQGSQASRPLVRVFSLFVGSANRTQLRNLRLPLPINPHRLSHQRSFNRQRHESRIESRGPDWTSHKPKRLVCTTISISNLSKARVTRSSINEDHPAAESSRQKREKQKREATHGHWAYKPPKSPPRCQPPNNPPRPSLRPPHKAPPQSL